MEKVLMSLSRVSSREIDWIIMLSCLLTLNLTLEREYECARPSEALDWSASSRPLMYRDRCIRIPRTISGTGSLVVHLMPSSSLMAEPSLVSSTPSSILPFFSAFLPEGKFISRKFLSVSLSMPSDESLAAASASSALLKGTKALSFSTLLMRERSHMAFCISSRYWPISSLSVCSKSAKPEALSKSTKRVDIVPGPVLS
mmetsp:Transcript_1938/g.2685  ORF Transcript_1938/g.2685 Transcript_1938/m.2685 type:complete len:200 (-) Transcript_1938:78-677(-)